MLFLVVAMGYRIVRPTFFIPKITWLLYVPVVAWNANQTPKYFLFYYLILVVGDTK